ncbi:MAG: peptidoglycan/LPS O-acetylase OafA/YrhL [Crocinitomix sp.]|jgi:peptidoglycan/LPS O-acetylase OafA/YrhL
MEGSKKIHFHSFDAFRFFAFFKVFIFHLPLFAVTADVSFKAFFYDHIKHGGGVGVSFFFVLSGFLITYILTHEKLRTGRINLKRFFVRRAFRIWPLFYLIVIMALLIPTDVAQSIGFHTNWGGYDPDWQFSLTFTENYKSLIMDAGPRTTPLSVFWSLCIEEHFYILWMIVFFFIRRKWIPRFLIVSVLVAVLLRSFEYQIYNNENVSTNDLFSNLDYFAISGLLGYLVAVNYERVANFVNSIPFAVRKLYVVFVLIVLFFQKSLFSHDIWFLNIFKHTMFSIIFAGLLLVFIPQKRNKVSEDKTALEDTPKRTQVWLHAIYAIFIGLIILNQDTIFVGGLWAVDWVKNTIVISLLASVVLLFVRQNGMLKISGTNIFTRLGKISYGLYVFHLIWIHVLVKICRNYEIAIDTWAKMISFGLITLVATIGLSMLSYHFFEMPILKLRERFFPNK